MKVRSILKREVSLSFTILALMGIVLPVCAKLALGVRFPDLVLEQVQPGTVLNFRQQKGMPFVILNQSDKKVDVIVESQIPAKNNLKEGYEAIPDPTWIKIIPDHFTMDTGEVAAAELILSVPTDPAYIGRHFQAFVRARTQNTGFLGVGVVSMIRFSIGTMGPESLKKESSAKALINLDVDVTPQSIQVPAYVLGQRLDFEKERGVSVKISNRGNEPLRFKLSVVAPGADLRRADYEAAPDASWLSIKPDRLKVKSNRIEAAHLTLQIPDKPELAGRKFMFLVKVGLDGSDIPLELYSRVFVTTAGKKE